MGADLVTAYRRDYLGKLHRVVTYDGVNKFVAKFTRNCSGRYHD